MGKFVCGKGIAPARRKSAINFDRFMVILPSMIIFSLSQQLFSLYLFLTPIKGIRKNRYDCRSRMYIGPTGKVQEAVEKYMKG